MTQIKEEFETKKLIGKGNPYQVDELKLRDRLRARSIKRWHTVEVSKEQSVAEHSHLVGVIAEHLLNQLIPSELITFEDRYMLLKYAQIHDESETITSDVSSVFKAYLKLCSVDFKDIIESLELRLTPELIKINAHFAKRPYLKYIAKLADLLEAYSFINVCSGGDDQHNKVVFEKLNGYIAQTCAEAQKQCGEFDWLSVQDIKEEITNGDSVILDFESLLKV